MRNIFLSQQNVICCWKKQAATTATATAASTTSNHDFENFNATHKHPLSSSPIILTHVCVCLCFQAKCNSGIATGKSNTKQHLMSGK